MNKHILKYIAMAIAAFCVVSCQDSESDLLEPKAYFENSLQQVTIPDTDNTLNVDITLNCLPHVCLKELRSVLAA